MNLAYKIIIVYIIGFCFFFIPRACHGQIIPIWELELANDIRIAMNQSKNAQSLTEEIDNILFKYRIQLRQEIDYREAYDEYADLKAIENSKEN